MVTKLCCLLFKRTPFETTCNLLLGSLKSYILKSFEAEDRAIGYELLHGFVLAHTEEALMKDFLLLLLEEMAKD